MKTVELNYNKTFAPCTYKQVSYMRTFANFHTKESTTQIMKRLAIFEASEIIEDLKNGEEITLK
jgi:hypothetical protein